MSDQNNIVCTKCNQLKPLESFRKYPKYRSKACIECENDYQRNYRRSKHFLKYPLYEREVLIKEGKNKCLRCGEIKTLDNFRINPRANTGYQNTCKSCKSTMERLVKIRLTYGITQEEYLFMLKDQDYKCKVCFTILGNKTCIDHNHDTGKVRGILCDSCNRGIGLLKDNKEVLERAIKYIDAGSCKIPLNGEPPK